MTHNPHHNSLTQLENTLDEYFIKKAPALPENIKELIVKFAPYLSIISIIVSLPALLFLVGLGGMATTMAPFGGVAAVSAIPTMWLGILLLIPTVLLEAMAIPGLFARSKTGWKYLYWSQLISIVSTLLQLNIFGAVVSAIIGFYILFQVKSHYK